jgi:hypothetical protein
MSTVERRGPSQTSIDESSNSRAAFDRDSLPTVTNRSHDIDGTTASTTLLATTLIKLFQSLDVRNRPLSLVEAAQHLRCEPDTLRRVPRSELPRYRVGREIIFYVDDLDRFVRTYRAVGRQAIEPLANHEEIDLDALADKARGRSGKRRTP